MDSITQEKLHQFLKNRVGRREFSQITFKSSVRIISSCRVDLKDRVQKRYFNKKLYSLLASKSISMPALRQRENDCEVLAEYFLNKGQAIKKSFSEKAVDMLCEYPWPGNISELKYVIEKASGTSKGLFIKSFHLMFDTVERNKEEDHFLSLNEIEKRHIKKILDYQGGNKTRAARTLGITVKTLYNKLYNYGMVDKTA